MVDGVLTTDVLSLGTASSSPVRIAILDEHGFGAEAFTKWIDRFATDLSVVAVDDDWMSLVRHASFPTDVVLLDAEPSGPVSLAARIRACRSTGAAVLLVASDRVPDDLNGIAGVVDRAASPELLVEAIRDAASGRPPRLPVVTPVAPRLSAGELQALRLYANGSTTAEAAQKMGVGYETVKTYLRRVRAKYAKLGRTAGRRAELVRRASEDGFLS